MRYTVSVFHLAFLVVTSPAFHSLYRGSSLSWNCRSYIHHSIYLLLHVVFSYLQFDFMSLLRSPLHLDTSEFLHFVLQSVTALLGGCKLTLHPYQWHKLRLLLGRFTRFRYPISPVPSSSLRSRRSRFISKALYMASHSSSCWSHSLRRPSFAGLHYPDRCRVGRPYGFVFGDLSKRSIDSFHAHWFGFTAYTRGWTIRGARLHVMPTSVL